MTMRKGILIALLLLPLLIFSQKHIVHAQTIPTKSYSAERFDSLLQVQKDGSLFVTETVVFNFVGGPFTQVFRDIPTDKTDGITILSASMDDKAVDQTDQFQVHQSNPVEATWYFDPTSDQTHMFVLRYQVMGVVQKTQNQDVLQWNVLPTNYDYGIASSTVRVSYPDQASLQITPEPQQGSAQVSTTLSQVIYTASDLAPNTPLEIDLRFKTGSLTTQTPHWQQAQDQINALILPSLLGGLAIFLVGILSLVRYGRRHRRQTYAEDTAQVSIELPDDLPPALAGALNNSNARPNWYNALAALFDLANRGVLKFEQLEAKKLYQGAQDYSITLQHLPPELRLHEQSLLNALFFTHGPREGASTKMSKMRNYNIASTYAFKRAVKQEMTERGFLDAERQRVRNRLGSVSFFAFLLSAIGAILSLALASWPIIFLLSGLFAIGIAAFIMWIAYSPLSDAGWQEAKRWQAFSQSLTAITHGTKQKKQSKATFEQYLPYATTFGQMQAWIDHFRSRGLLVVPPWFQSLATSPADKRKAFTTMITHTYSVSSSPSAGRSFGGGASGSFGGGFGGGGAAGGGSSGAH